MSATGFAPVRKVLDALQRVGYGTKFFLRLCGLALASLRRPRLVIDQIRGMMVNDALSLLKFSKKHAAVQIAKTLESAVANAEQAARAANASLDVDTLFVKKAIINEGPKLKRWTPAAMGRATPMIKRTSHVEIVVAEKEGR